MRSTWLMPGSPCRSRCQRPESAQAARDIERGNDEADLGDPGGGVLGDAGAHRHLVADEGDGVEQLVGDAVGELAGCGLVRAKATRSPKSAAASISAYPGAAR